MKKFFETIEEKYVFPIGRKTWQIIALILLIAVGGCVIYYLVNTLPTTREKVVVTRNEVVQNKTDTTITVSAAPASGCELAEYNSWLDTLRSDLPVSEWKNLGEYSEPYETYVRDEYGYYLTDDNGDYIRVTQMDFYPNPKAVPNILQNIYNSRNLDSTDYCDRISVLKTLHAMLLRTDRNFSDEAVSYFASILSNDAYISIDHVAIASRIQDIAEGSGALVKDYNSFRNFAEYINYFYSNVLSDDKIEIAARFVKAHKAIPGGKKNVKYFPLMKTILNSDMDVKDLDAAMNDFNDDIVFYDSKKINKSLPVYLGIYEEKLDRAKSLQAAKKQQKKINRANSMKYGAMAFLSIVGIATVLLLFSIQSMLRKQFGKDQESAS